LPIESGIVFVITSRSISGLGGSAGSSIGYGGIDSSFAIEFDTKYDGQSREGWQQ